MDVVSTGLYVSVFPRGEGLLPEDRPIEIPPAGSDLDEEDFLTDGDINANRIRTLLWNSAETSHQLESAYEL
ncbi:MAG: hypothetical protein GTO03_11325, partial [Planctomycetales bacterium]|nr:hypothetical protein [Planctomycetales bacterium]